MSTLTHSAGATDAPFRSASRASHGARRGSRATLLDRITTRLAAAETPLAFVSLWAVWAPLQVAAVVHEMLLPAERSHREARVDPRHTATHARPFYSAKFREIAPGLAESRRIDRALRADRAHSSI